MNTVLHCTVMLVVVLIHVPGYAAERLVPYDDFNAPSINPDKWCGGEYSPAIPGLGTEVIRQLQDGWLRLLYRSYGATDSDSRRLRSELALFFRDPAAVTTIQATVRVTDVATIGCPDNPEPTAAWAVLSGRFFGSPAATPDGEVRDMAASVGVSWVSGSYPPDVFRVRALVFLCSNRLCTAGMRLHRLDLGPIKPGETARLRVQWDRANQRFIFQRDEAPEVFAPYAVSDTAPPSIAVKMLDTTLYVPNCAATPRPMAFIDAWFDEVMVNESAAPAGER
jgi:hypothetical protein